MRVAKAFEVYLRSMDITAYMLSEIRLELDKPEVIIRPAVWHIGSMDRVNDREVAALGEEAVEESLAALRKLRKKQKWRRWFNLKSS